MFGWDLVLDTLWNLYIPPSSGFQTGDLGTHVTLSRSIFLLNYLTLFHDITSMQTS